MCVQEAARKEEELRRHVAATTIQQYYRGFKVLKYAHINPIVSHNNVSRVESGQRKVNNK